MFKKKLMNLLLLVWITQFFFQTKLLNSFEQTPTIRLYMCVCMSQCGSSSWPVVNLLAAKIQSQKARIINNNNNKRLLNASVYTHIHTYIHGIEPFSLFLFLIIIIEIDITYLEQF